MKVQPITDSEEFKFSYKSNLVYYEAESADDTCGNWESFRHSFSRFIHDSWMEGCLATVIVLQWLLGAASREPMVIDSESIVNRIFVTAV